MNVQLKRYNSISSTGDSGLLLNFGDGGEAICKRGYKFGGFKRTGNIYNWCGGGIFR